MVNKVKNDVVVAMGGKTRIHLLCDDDVEDTVDGMERKVVLIEGVEKFLEVGEVEADEILIEPLLKSLCVALADVGDVVDEDVVVKIILFIKRYHIFKGFVNVTNNIKLK